MSKERAKIYLKSALSEFELYESLSIKDYLKSAYDNMVKALKELKDWVWKRLVYVTEIKDNMENKGNMANH